MKNVLFATTALVAFAGAAAAEVSFSGALTAGYNDGAENGLFFDADLDVSASVDMGDNVTATASVQLVEWDDDITDFDADITVEIAYTGDPLSASLKMGDMGDKGASEYFYADRSGMAIDVENHDGDDEVRALLEFGSFGVAVGCDMNGSQTCDSTTGFNFGAGATFGSIELGLGYDDADNAGGEKMAISADAAFGAATVGVSYISNETAGDDSIGVVVGYTVSDALSVGAYYAVNSAGASDDSYGADVDYTAGALTLGVFFDHTTAATDEYGLDVAYAVNDRLMLNAGYLSGSAATLAGATIEDHYYVGVDYTVNEAISATVSYSTADEDLGSIEYREGISAFITATF